MGLQDGQDFFPDFCNPVYCSAVIVWNDQVCDQRGAGTKTNRPPHPKTLDTSTPAQGL